MSMTWGIPGGRKRKGFAWLLFALYDGLRHVFDKDTVASCRIIDRHVGDCADQFSVLNNWTAAHE